VERGRPQERFTPARATVIVLDTHAWLWLSLEPRRLSSAATAAIRRAANDGGLAIASISLWEVAMMLVRGRVIPHGTPESWLGALVDRSGVTVKEITPSIAALATHFPDSFPADPADRLIAATARAEGMPLVSRDTRIRASAVVETIW
jgi:PIN domain nuclease of toxin-antitoxin system